MEYTHPKKKELIELEKELNETTDQFEREVIKINMQEIIRDNIIQVDNNLFPILSKEEQLRIAQMKKEEAIILEEQSQIDYWTNFINSIKPEDKNNQTTIENTNQEKNKTNEVEQEEKKDKKYEIEEIIANGISTLTIFKTGNRRLESPYMDVKVQSSNAKLKINLGSLLVTLSLDDAVKDNNFIKAYKQILETAQTEQDVRDMLAFLQAISSVGELGAKYNNSLIPETQKKMQEISNKPKQEEKPKTVDITNKLNEINKSIELLDMKLDQTKTDKHGVDPEDLYAIAKSYESKIEDLEDLYKNEIDKEKQIELEFKIDSLRKKAKDIRAYASQIEELANFSFEF